jgi:Trypsin/FG-GAP-like repeat
MLTTQRIHRTTTSIEGRTEGRLSRRFGKPTAGATSGGIRRLIAALTAALLAGIVPPLAPPTAGAITGGSAVTNNDLAFVAEVNNTAVSGVCTGSLIHPSWVLTAAHCAAPTSVGDVAVRVGNTVRGTGGELRRVARILRHPLYTGGHNDVALLQLSSPVTSVTPVRLATPADAYLWDGVTGSAFTKYDQGIATGWGKDATGAFPNRLQFVGVNITPPSPDNLGIKRITVDRGVCPGDSGGPLLVTVNGTMVVAGVLKAAPGACGGGSYSEVGAGSNRDWILSNMTKLPYTPFGVADWDRDGHQDIVARQDATGDGWLYPGQSVRGFSGLPRVKIGNGWNGYTSFGVADWDRDGHRDLIAREDATGDLWLYPGQSVRGYSSVQRVKIGNGWNGYMFFGVADWDRDGHQDILTRNDVSGDLWLYPGQSVRGYSSASPVRLGWGPSWSAYSSFGVTDYDRDGHQDLIARDNDSGYLWLYPGDSRRAALSTPRVLYGVGWSGHTSFGAVDWERDGHKDIIVRHDATGDLWLYPGQSTRGPSSTPPVKIGAGW